MIFLAMAALMAVPGAGRSRAPAESPPQQQEQLSDVELRERVQTYLGSIDRSISPASWRALGSRAAPLLEAIIADPSQFPSRRAKAVDGLVAVAPDRAVQLVGKLARDENEETVVRVAAVHGAGQVFPSAKALSELRPVLQAARSAGLRAEAADVMARKKGGCAAVRQQVARERPEHRGAFDRALKRCKE